MSVQRRCSPFRFQVNDMRAQDVRVRQQMRGNSALIAYAEFPSEFFSSDDGRKCSSWEVRSRQLVMPYTRRKVAMLTQHRQRLQRLASRGRTRSIGEIMKFMKNLSSSKDNHRAGFSAGYKYGQSHPTTPEEIMRGIDLNSHPLFSTLSVYYVT